MYEVAELICLKCLNRWIGVYHADTPLKDFECQCGEKGYVIKTGQALPDVDSYRDNDPRFKTMVSQWGEDEAKRKYNAFVKGAWNEI